jgi:hypothetical protein
LSSFVLVQSLTIFFLCDSRCLQGNLEVEPITYKESIEYIIIHYTTYVWLLYVFMLTQRHLIRKLYPTCHSIDEDNFCLDG